MRFRRHLPALALIAAVAAAFFPALQGGFIWDDDAHVEHNLCLRSAQGLTRIWSDPSATPQYYPLTHTTFWLEYQLWGLRPAGYHAVNVLLHALAAVLVAHLLLALGFARSAAWLGAALFALHPVQVESVAWITERKNVLSTVFYLSAMWAYLSHARWSGGNGSRLRLLLSFGLFVLALLSKTVTASLPAVLLLLQFWKEGRIRRSDGLKLVPFFAAGAVMGGLTAWLEKASVGAAGPEWALSAAERVLVAGRAFWFYLGKLAWPASLTFIYPRFALDPAAWSAYFYPAAAIGLFAALWLLRARWGRGPLTAALFFVVTLSPALGFFDVYPMRYSFVADHFQYLACLGPLALAATLAERALRRGHRALHVAGAAGALALLGMLTWRQCGLYADAETLWRDVLRKNPQAWMAHVNLGGLLAARGDAAEALEHYGEALRIQQGLPAAFDLANTYANLGMVLLKQGRAEGEDSLRRALEVDPGNPHAHHNLGVRLLELRRPAEALAHFDLALARSPDYAKAHAGRGDALLALGRPEPAAAAYLRAVELDPDDPALRRRLAATRVHAP